MTKKYDYLVFIARMQPYHIGHHAIIERALELSENVIIVIGSPNSSRTIRNPLTCWEREQLVIAAFDDNLPAGGRLIFHYQEDHMYNDQRWLAEVQSAIHRIVYSRWQAGPYRIGLIGHEKDASSYYLKLFPGWEAEGVAPVLLNGAVIDSTKIREITFGGLEFNEESILSPMFPNPVVHAYWYHFLHDTKLFEEYEFVLKYKEQWKHSPYPPTFVTVDAVVTISGHVLLIRRGAMPGLGLWALPGGFLDQGERVRDGAIRELYEETKLAVPRAVIEGSIVGTKVYDHPNRSSRGRTITHTTHVALKDATKLPKIKGSDDAAKAKWVPIGEVLDMKHLFFEDHYSMLEDTLGL